MLLSMLKIGAVIPGLVLLLGLTSCGITIPQDPEGTLEKVSGGILRVGVSEHAQWVQLPPTGDPQGIEPELVEEFADTDAVAQFLRHLLRRPRRPAGMRAGDGHDDGLVDRADDVSA